MLIRDSKEYGTMILNGVEYNSIFNNGIEYGFASSGNFRPRTQAIIDYATTNGYTLPSDLNAYNSLIAELEDTNALNNLDMFYCFFGDGDADFKTINIVDTTKFKGTVGSGIINSLDGLKGNGTVDGVIDTNNILDDYSGKYQYLNACRGYFLSSKSEVVEYSTGTVDGLVIGLNRQCLSQWADVRQRINADRNSLASSPSILSMASFGIVTLSRNNATQASIEVVGAGVATFNQTGVNSPFGYPQLIFRNSGFYGKVKLGAYFTGAKMTDAERLSLDTALKTYYTAISS